MQDEIFMRTWNDGHGQFSADLDRGFKRVAAAIAKLGRGTATEKTPATPKRIRATR